MTKESFADPKGTVHVVEGNGGVPGTHAGSKLFPCRKDAAPLSAAQDEANGSAKPTAYPPEPLGYFRMCGWGMNYGRLVTTNASVLTYEHVANSGGRVTDSWAIVKTKPAAR